MNGAIFRDSDGHGEAVLECGHAESLHSDITRGYGTDAKGNRHCYDCCHASDLSTMKETGRIDAYLSGNRITNWPGRSLLTVQREWETSAGGFLSGHRITRVYALATDGSRWHGRGPGQGMYIRMRRYKAGAE